MKTRVSALMDGELEVHEHEETLRALRSDPALRTKWQDFHLVGAALRRERGLDFDVGARVMQALAEEPTVLAPMPARRSEWIRPALALAASAAGVAVVAWVALAPQGNIGDSGRGALALALKAPAARMAAAPVVHASVPAASSQLQEYLVAHQAHSTSGGLASGTQYVRTVSAMREGR